MTDTKITKVQNYLEAAKRQDIPAMLSLFADDLVYSVPGNHALAGETHGKSAAVEYFGKLMEMTGGTYGITGIVDWLVSDHRLALIANEKMSRDGKSVAWTRIILFTFRGELVSEVALFDDKLSEINAVLQD
jgi:ketosteroid isomerase-like protein